MSINVRHIIICTALALCAQSAVAQNISCSFTKECQIGKRCAKISYDAEFIRHDDGKSYAIIADAAIEAIGVTMDFDGAKGTLVSKNGDAIKPYAGFYVLSFSKVRAVLSKTGLDADDMPYSVTMLGTCEVGK